ncbi:MAG: nicotinate-nucleotide adenylyltransferase [Crocinitomicaceae bacterium]|nr:nicotinate-nucleotide adenylyltransferase [Crocinitomicaceae bacterium]
MKIGLYFGTFNPVHVGHLVIANYMASNSDLDQVWLVVSPQNPLKKKKNLLEDYHRLVLVKEGIKDNPKLKASDIEFKLPVPSYTSTTLAYLKEKYPENEFALIMGEDNLRTFHKWQNHEMILENHEMYVYPRVHTIQELEAMSMENEQDKNDLAEHKNVHMCNDVPVMNISSSFIRNQIKEGKDVQYLLTDAVHKYLVEMNFYQPK